MNLLNLLKYQLGSNLTEQMSKFLGENPENVQSAMDATLPSVLSVFVKKASEKTGANDIMDTIKLGNHDGSMLNYLSGLFSGGSSTNSLMSSGDVLANRFLGNKKSVLSDAIANFSGINSDSSNSLIKMVMPLVLGVIGKQVKNQNLDTSGLMSLLSAQKGHIGAAIPSGFTIKKATNQPVNTSTTPPVVKREVSTTTKTINERLAKEQSNSKNTAAEVNTPPPSVNTPQKNSGSGFLRFLPFIIGGILLLALLIFGLRACAGKKATASKTTKDNSKTIKDKPNTDDTKNVTAADIKASATEDNEPNNDSYNNSSNANSSNTVVTPSSPPGAFKNRINGLMSGGSTGSAIDLDELRFSGGSPVITRSSRHVVHELADIMNSNSSINIRLESSDLNRAVSLKKGLMDAGIDRNRISTSSGGNSGVQMYIN